MNFTEILEKDEKLSRELRVAEQPGLRRNIAKIFAHSGDSWIWFVVLLPMKLLLKGSWQIWASVLFYAIFFTAVTVLVLKFTIKRQRPEGEWGQIYRKTDPHSFPSGHAARGLLIGILALSMGPAWLGIILFTWGPLVGIARIAMGVHYVSDVVAGWFVGSVIGYLVIQNMCVVSAYP
jgi:membrane-associated phospholipid phosphatase